MTTHDRFLSIFRSRENACAFGRMGTELSAKGKRSCKYVTSHKPYTAEDVERHLAGEVSIVAIPILLDGICWWGAADLDNYADLDLNALNGLRAKHGLPFYICASKSGGAHLFVFFPQPRPADKVRLLIQTWMAKLGVLYAPDGSLHEIFPKQTYTDKCGNGINLPFFGDAAGFEKFSPVTYDVPVDQWDLDPPAQSKREASGPSSEAKLKGVKLRLGWDPETQLKEADLVFDVRHVGDTVYFDYYGEMGKCLLAGRKHDGGTDTNARMSTFVFHKDTRHFYHQCFADGCRQMSNKTATALSKLAIDLNLIAEDEEDFAEEGAMPQYPAECLDGQDDAIAAFTKAVTTGTGIPPQYVYMIVAGAVLHAADQRIGYPNHEDIRTNSYALSISADPRTGKGVAWKRAFGEPGLAKALLARTGPNRSGIHLLEGTNCGSGAFAAKKIADIREEEDRRLLALNTSATSEGNGIPPGTDIGITGTFEIESEGDVYRILQIFNLSSERDQAVKLNMGDREITAAFKRDWRKAVKLADAEILKAREETPTREPQADDDYLRVCMVFDELLNAYKGGDSSIEEMLLGAYERTLLAHGSFKNGERRVDHVSVSFHGDVTRKVFDEIFTGKASAGSGFLHRCKLTYGVKKRVADWQPIDAEKAIAAVRTLSEALAKLPEARIGGNKRFVPPETNEAKRLREEFFCWLDQQNPKCIPELDSHFRRDVLVRVIATGASYIDVKHVRPAIAWTKYQLALREALYPADSEDVVGQIASKMLTLLDKDPSKPWTDSQFNRLLHFNTRNHGTSEHYVRARLSLLRSTTIAQFGINRKGYPMYQRAGNFVQVSAEDKRRFEEYKTEKEKPSKKSPQSVHTAPPSIDASSTEMWMRLAEAEDRSA